jgi:hypothetical protein
MARFEYEGFTKGGEERAGFIEAPTLEEAAEKIRHDLKIFARSLKPAEPIAPISAPAAPAQKDEWQVKQADTRMRREEPQKGWQESLVGDVGGIEKVMGLLKDAGLPEETRASLKFEMLKDACLRAYRLA